MGLVRWWRRTFGPGGRFKLSFRPVVKPADLRGSGESLKAINDVLDRLGYKAPSKQAKKP